MGLGLFHLFEFWSAKLYILNLFTKSFRKIFVLLEFNFQFPTFAMLKSECSAAR